MSRYITVTTEVDVDIDLDSIDTDDLVAELESRGESILESSDLHETLVAIWQKRRQGQDYQRELDDLIYNGLGRVV